MSQDLLKVTSLLTQCDAKSYVQNEKCCNLTRAAQSSLRAMIVGGADTEGTGQFIDNQEVTEGRREGSQADCQTHSAIAIAALLRQF